MTVWSRIRWTNVARAAAGVTALLVVIAWPRLGSPPPRVPDGTPVPVATARPPEPALDETTGARLASLEAEERRDAAATYSTVEPPGGDGVRGGRVRGRRALTDERGGRTRGARRARRASRPGALRRQRPRARRTTGGADRERRSPRKADSKRVKPTAAPAAPVPRPRATTPAPGITAAPPPAQVPRPVAERPPRGDFGFER